MQELKHKRLFIHFSLHPQPLSLQNLLTHSWFSLPTQQPIHMYSLQHTHTHTHIQPSKIYIYIYIYIYMLVCKFATFNWTKSLHCKDAFYQGFRYSEVFQKILHSLQVRKFGSLPVVRTTCRTVRTPSCPMHQPSRRRVKPSGRSSD